MHYSRLAHFVLAGRASATFKALLFNAKFSKKTGCIIESTKKADTGQTNGLSKIATVARDISRLADGVP
jgi:hypothetical protein